MARNENATSVRQQAFTKLDDMTGEARKDAVAALVEEFKIGLPYARTLYQEHRNLMKKSGGLVKVYSVKENKDTGPSVITTHVLKASKTDATSPDEAVNAYVNSLSIKIEAAKKIDVQAILASEQEAEKAAEPAKTEEAPVAAEKTGNKTAEKTSNKTAEKTGNKTAEKTEEAEAPAQA